MYKRQYQRYALASVVARQWSLGQALLHQENVCRVSEQARAKKAPAFAVAVAYDERCRRKWARQSALLGQNFDLAAAVKQVDEDRVGAGVGHRARVWVTPLRSRSAQVWVT